jgi:hypothetical protein
VMLEVYRVIAGALVIADEDHDGRTPKYAWTVGQPWSRPT